MDRYWLGVLTVPLILGCAVLACLVFYGLWQFLGAFLEAAIVRRRWRGSDRGQRARVAAVMATSIRAWGFVLPGGVGMVSLALRPRGHYAISSRQFAALENDFREALAAYESTRADKD